MEKHSMEQSLSEEIPNYYAVITAAVRYDDRLKPNAKLLYGEISALANKKGYSWATNSYFARLYRVNRATISRWISQLAEYGHIKIAFEPVEGNDKNVKRYISISQGGIDKIVKGGIDEKSKDNITSENNKVNTTKKGAQLVFPESLNDVRFMKAWNEWVEYRKEIKKRLTPRMIKMQFKDLESWGIEGAIAAINNSIKNGWQGLFDPKNNNKNTGLNNTGKKVLDTASAIKGMFDNDK